MGIDPVEGGTHKMTSDEFFYNNNDKFDIIFIDGLHQYEQVIKDVKNSLNCLTKNGIIDCQIQNDHLISMGSLNIPRKDFLSKLADLRDRPKFWPTYWKCIMA